jgi:hypothetical protein
MKRWRLKVGGCAALLATTGAVACISTEMPCTSAVHNWAREEVAATRAGDDFGKSTMWTVEVDLKNVIDRADGWYEITIPERSVDGRGEPRPKGGLALDPPLLLTLRKADQWVWDKSLANVSPAAEMQPIPADLGRTDPGRYPAGAMRLGARVDRDADRNFTVSLFGEDRTVKRWVFLGKVVAGKGMQSSFRNVGQVLLTVPAWIADGVIVLTSPIWMLVLGVRM